VTVQATDPNASEPGTDKGTFTVTRTNPNSGPLVVSYTTAGEALNGTDYQQLSGTVIIQAGQSSATVNVVPIDDGVTENSETVILTLSTGTVYQVGVPSSATVVIAASLAETNFIVNPGFESGENPWVFETNRKGIFAVEGPGFEGDNAAHVTLTTIGIDMQLYQANVPLDPKQDYRLTFVAYSTGGHNMTVLLHKHGRPGTNYGLDRMVNLTAGWKKYTLDFRTKGFSNPVTDGHLAFSFIRFASGGDQYWIDNVVLSKR
jgi:hypothetical protein